MSSEIYRRLQPIELGVLKNDAYKHAEEITPPEDCFSSLPGAKLLELGISQLYVLPRCQKTSSRAKKGPRERSQYAIQLFSSYNAFTTPHVEELDLKLG